MREAGDLLKRRPGLGTLTGEAQTLRGPVGPGTRFQRPRGLRRCPLPSCACCRCCPLHLSFPEIAAEMFLSGHTIRSEAVSIYRKLGASSRSQAVSRSVKLGLLAG